MLGADVRAQLLQAYRLTINIFPQIAYFGLDVQARLDALARAPDLAADAAAYALQTSKPDVALEILEEGRAVFWMQYSRLRSSFNRLPSALATELTQAAHDLEAGARQSTPPSRADADEVSLHEEELAQRRRLSQKFEALIAQARSLPGLERFMLSDTFSTLSMAAQAAPVVVLVASSTYCGAVLLRKPDSKAEHLQFGHNVGPDYLNQISRAMHGAQQNTRGSLDTRAIRRIAQKKNTSWSPLDEVWSEIMQVIVKALGYKVIKNCCLPG